MIKKVVVVGAGLMGNSIAQVFASNPGLEVILKTRQLKPDRWEPIEQNLDMLVARGVLTREEKLAIIGRIRFETKMPLPTGTPTSLLSVIPKKWR